MVKDTIQSSAFQRVTQDLDDSKTSTVLYDFTMSTAEGDKKIQNFGSEIVDKICCVVCRSPLNDEAYNSAIPNLFIPYFVTLALL